MNFADPQLSPLGEHEYKSQFFYQESQIEIKLSTINSFLLGLPGKLI